MTQPDPDTILSAETKALVEQIVTSHPSPTVRPTSFDLSAPARVLVPVATPLLNGLPRRDGGTCHVLEMTEHSPVSIGEGNGHARSVATQLYMLKLAQEAAIFFALCNSSVAYLLGNDFPSFPKDPGGPTSSELMHALAEAGVALDVRMDQYYGYHADDDAPVTVSGYVGVILP